jgi:uncharacterized protein (TIGR02271 family)
MSDPSNREERIPLAEERLVTRKHTVERGRVRIRTVIDENTRWIEESVASENVIVERIPIDREVEAVPPVRQEGDTTIIPVVDEVLVIERRLILKEEVRMRKERHVEQIRESVSLKTMHAVVERDMPPSKGQITDIENSGAHNDDTNTDGAV